MSFIKLQDDGVDGNQEDGLAHHLKLKIRHWSDYVELASLHDRSNVQPLEIINGQLNWTKVKKWEHQL